MKPNREGWPYFPTWKSYALSPWMYIRRAYQSPCSGTHWAVQWAQMPNFASRNQSGAWYCLSESHVGWNGPAAMERDGPLAAASAAPAEVAPWPRYAAGTAAAISLISCRRVMFVLLLAVVIVGG